MRGTSGHVYSGPSSVGGTWPRAGRVCPLLLSSGMDSTWHMVGITLGLMVAFCVSGSDGGKGPPACFSQLPSAHVSGPQGQSVTVPPPQNPIPGYHSCSWEAKQLPPHHSALGGTRHTWSGVSSTVLTHSGTFTSCVLWLSKREAA